MARTDVASKRINTPRLKIQQDVSLGHEESPDPLVSVAVSEVSDTTRKHTITPKQP